MRNKPLILCILSLLLSSIALGQETLPDPTQVSDQQIQEGIERAKSQGFTQQQIESMARARGYSEAEINNLRSRVQEITSKSGNSALDEAQLREELSEFDFDLEELEEELTDNDLVGGELDGRIFGASLFANKNLTFAPSVNIPTPEHYVVGPGDELVVDIWGASEKTYQLTISPDGVVKIPYLGPIYVSGLEMSEVKSKLLERLKKIYAGLNKSTYAQVSLGRIRSIKVNMIGEIKTPGTYTISSLSTVLHALYMAGGLSQNGSYRNVEVFRLGEKVSTFDLYDYLLNADTKDNIILEDQDIIKVPIYQKHIKISGEIKKPGIYELDHGENLQNLIEMAGGFTDEAYSKLLTVRRRTDLSKKIVTIKSENFDQFELNSGDAISISKILDSYENRVTIKGAVRRPGEYELTLGLSLSELIQKAEGITADAFMERGHILRYNDDLTFKNIDFSVKEAISGDYDVLLKPEDLVTIKTNFQLHNSRIVSIKGAVRSPGSFPYQDSLTVEDVIFMANGFDESASRSVVEVARRTNDKNSPNTDITSITFSFQVSEYLKLDSTASKFILEPFDVVTVRRSPYYNPLESVEIDGQVKFPGHYVLKNKHEKISDLILRAGGLTDFAFVEGSSLVRKSQYYKSNVSGSAEIATIRRKELLSSMKKDEVDTYLKHQESIGIDLSKIIEKPGSVHDLELKGGDILHIPKQLETVGVRGEVLYSSNLVYQRKNSLKSYIDLAGGFSDDARISKVYVVHANGSAKRTKNFLWFRSYPKITPGSEIVVPKKPEKETLSAQAWVALASSIATLALVVDRLAN